MKNLNLRILCAGVLLFNLIASLASAQGIDRIYWSSEDVASSEIARIDIDGNNEITIHNNASVGSTHPVGIDIDWSAGKLYFAGRNGTISRSNLDGSSKEVIVSSGITQAFGLKLDVDGGKIYWCDIAGDKIQRANLNGTNVETLISVTRPTFLELDLVNDKVYYTRYQNDVVARMNLDGSSNETLISGTIDAPYGIALNVLENKMYISSNFGGSIYSANLDGTSVQNIAASEGAPSDIEYDSFGDKIYWIDFYSDIYRADADGSNVTLITSAPDDISRAILLDFDTDLDGTRNSSDNCPSDPDKAAPGACGCGIADTDSDADGTADCNDSCDADPDKVAPGICGCGVADTDSDTDGTANCNDGCSADANKIIPGACGCGVPDEDSDTDGTEDCNESCDNDPAKTTPGACGCGVQDSDSDSDDTLDCNESCDNDTDKTEPGICGCGIADTDSDSDGTADCNDACDQDANKISAGICGCGEPDSDSDENNILDCLPENAVKIKVDQLLNLIESKSSKAKQIKSALVGLKQEVDNYDGTENHSKITLQERFEEISKNIKALLKQIKNKVSIKKTKKSAKNKLAALSQWLQS